MRLVIDIPEHYYENNIKKELPICLSEDNVVAILPKGHGRLIDAGVLAVALAQIDWADTIVEADKGE